MARRRTEPKGTTDRKKGAAPRRARRSGPAKAGRRRRLGWRLARWAAIAAIWMLIAGIGIVAYYAYDLPSVDALDRYARPPNVTLVASDGTTLASYGERYGQAVAVDDLPPYVAEAVLATEDRRFYSHFGIDLLGLFRAAIANISAGRIVQGGSTITQQLAKNLFLTPARTLKRKVQEVLLALWLEHRFTKDQILTIYLNRVYLGSGTYGIDAAARRYFGKPARAISLYEAAMLAGLLKAPSRYNPARNPDRARERAERVLASMVEAGYLSADVAANARAVETRIAPRGAGLPARYFADWVLDRVRGYVGYVDSDLKVYTTLDPDLQRFAQRAVRAALDDAGLRSTEAAVVVLGTDGAVRALVGGRDYRRSQFNRATRALRQPGSAFKPFVYLAGFEAGLRPSDRFEDRPLRFGDWSPRNYGDRYYGTVTLQEALAKSLNSVAVQVADKVGPDAVVRVARRLGITSPLKENLSLALGTSEVTLLELTAAYGVFANGGHGVWPYGIREIQDATGRVLYRRSGSGPGIVVDPEDAARMNAVLAAVVREGTGRAAALTRPAAGKTGTSQDFRDAWFVGYTADLVAGVWIGNDDGMPMARITGGGLPARLWRTIMTEAHKGLSPAPLPGLGAGAAARPKRALGALAPAAGPPAGIRIER